MGLFFPKQPVFFEHLQSLNGSLKDISKLFQEFASSQKDVATFARRAKEIEKEADHKTHAIINKLNKTFITPFDREDIYLLAHELDDVVDMIESVMANVHCYGINYSMPAIAEFAPLMVQASDHMESLIEALKGQKYAKDFAEMKIKIHELEDKGDAVFNSSISKLLQEETDAMKALKEKDILEGLENIMDKFQHVSDIIEGILVKSS